MMTTVASTPTTTWPGQGRQTVLVVGGDLSGASIPQLLAHVATAVAGGPERVLLDVAAVARVDRESLLALARVRGRAANAPSTVVDVVGVRASHFTRMLGDEPAGRIETTRAVIRELLRPAAYDSYLPTVTARDRPL